MKSSTCTTRFILVILLLILVFVELSEEMSQSEKMELKNKVVEMFNHGYQAYMTHAYPADELMPLSCKGRYRGSEPSRGDIDDALGNFSLTLVDTLDTLVILNQLDEFESAVKLVIRDVTFDTDVVVSVFETNIRMLGGLLSSHVLATYVKKRKKIMNWYQDQLLDKAKDLGYRLLPAFNTSTGIPFPRINLKYGINKDTSRTGHEKDTCTACAGTMLLEFAALSRLTGESIFEEKAHKAMEFLWQQRHRSSDLVGTVINIHNGDWVRRDAGVGAGIDSYYEYLLKGYILLGNELYLDRFNKHYDAIMRYINQGPMMMDVHMHKPTSISKHFMDALWAFWPGLQVLKGDLKPAIEIHEMLYQITQRHNFLPEAFTTDFRVHWGQHPLRPEFVESTYFLYKATNDPYYLEVGKTVIENLQRHAEVPCGFAAIRDVTSGTHEDQLDSFVLSETFKYLFLLFSEKEDLLINIDDYIFTTEAHLLPLHLSSSNFSKKEEETTVVNVRVEAADERYDRSCPNNAYLFPDTMNYAHAVRSLLKGMVHKACPKPNKIRRTPRIRAADFIAGNANQMLLLRQMGIRLATMADGRVQLLHTASDAASPEDAEEGMLFMQEMIEFSKNQQKEVPHDPRIVKILSTQGKEVELSGGPAQFGMKLTVEGVFGQAVVADPIKACSELNNAADLHGKIVVLERGDCMFIDKARRIEQFGALGGIVIDHNQGTSAKTAPLFAMSGDGKNDVKIPMVFLFREEGEQLLNALGQNLNLEVMLAAAPKSAQSSSSQGPTDDKKTPRTAIPPEAPSIPQPSGQEEPGDRKVGSVYYMKTNAGLAVDFELRDMEQARLSLEPFIQILNTHDSKKHLRFKLDSKHEDIDEHGQVNLGTLYIGFFENLKKFTNFENLSQHAEYRLALTRLLEIVFSPGNRLLDEKSQEVLNQLAEELVIDVEQKTTAVEEQDGSQSQKGETKEEKTKSEIPPGYREVEKGVYMNDAGGIYIKISADDIAETAGGPEDVSQVTIKPNDFQQIGDSKKNNIFGKDKLVPDESLLEGIKSWTEEMQQKIEENEKIQKQLEESERGISNEEIEKISQHISAIKEKSKQILKNDLVNIEEEDINDESLIQDGSQEEPSTQSEQSQSEHERTSTRTEAKKDEL